MKPQLSIFIVLFSQFITGWMNHAEAQIVNIPDANFKAYLVSRVNINTNGDSEIQASEAAVYTGSLNVSFENIYDLTGIEAFTSLNHLACVDNHLSNLNLSSNTALTTINCRINQLTSLILPSSASLTHLYCDYNQLTSLNISPATALSILECNSNNLIGLNVSANTSLTKLICYGNDLTGLNVSSNTALTTLHCDFNQLTSLNVSANPNLTFLMCGDNPLTSLNVQNGHNTSLTWFVASVTPADICIQVDNPAWANINWTNAKDVNDVFSNDCSNVIMSVKTIPDEEATLSVYPNPFSTNATIKYTIEKNADVKLEVYNIMGEHIRTLHHGNLPKGEYSCQFNTSQSGLPSGIYYIKLSLDNLSRTYKVVATNN